MLLKCSMHKMHKCQFPVSKCQMLTTKLQTIQHRNLGDALGGTFVNPLLGSDAESPEGKSPDTNGNGIGINSGRGRGASSPASMDTLQNMRLDTSRFRSSRTLLRSSIDNDSSSSLGVGLDSGSGSSGPDAENKEKVEKEDEQAGVERLTKPYDIFTL